MEIMEVLLSSAVRFTPLEVVQQYQVCTYVSAALVKTYMVGCILDSIEKRIAPTARRNLRNIPSQTADPTRTIILLCGPQPKQYNVISEMVPSATQPSLAQHGKAQPLSLIHI